MSDSSSIIDFDSLCDLLAPLNVINSPAELHGFLCGKLTGGAQLSHSQWLEKAWELLDAVETPTDEASNALVELFETTQQQLQGNDFRLQLLVPDDDTDMSQRLMALGQWTYGFLTGLGNSGLAGTSQLSPEVAEGMRDLAAIAQINDSSDPEETDENDYNEVLEYVRVVVLNMYEEIGRSANNAASPQPPIH
ncbi:UPF0149 family protein [Marinibactrum halimedae]|uniref:UPF0149 protein n=1 Tax=Marinibactrum halimedae TaxID=1444977 RepID=A0AA37WME4_9GAMM|nr:UPF0149 family protein [Marinibactrum halimedae]MCD9457721.1 UPF0149 family protein [Marinibactrum halimedae]GLS24906.1 UPF0149 protein [Marinibactrum halimedae]